MSQGKRNEMGTERVVGGMNEAGLLFILSVWGFLDFSPGSLLKGLLPTVWPSGGTEQQAAFQNSLT